MQETWVRSLGREDALEKGVATHSSILAWRIPWTEDPLNIYKLISVIHHISKLKDKNITNRCRESL